MRVPSAFELIWRESNGSVVNACRWHAEPTLTEPAGENSTPLTSTTHFHVRENIRKTPAWPSFIGYVGVCFLGAGWIRQNKICGFLSSQESSNGVSCNAI